MLGEYFYVLDAKNRVNFPAKYREELGETFYITKALGDECIAVYSQEDWDKLDAKIKALPISKARAIQRHFYSSSNKVTPDRQGRILLSQGLREYASIKKDIVVAGVGNRCEIWDKDKWDSVINIAASDMQENMLEAEM